VQNLYVVDASFFVSCGAFNPSLTIAANALRVGGHILNDVLKAPVEEKKNSSATSVLNHIAALMPSNVEFNVYDGLGDLAHFDDSDNVPAEVIKFRELIAESDGVFICTPEYAFGVPGTLKNALDWTVSSGELTYKPVALITAASVGKNAHASLLLILSALTAKVTEEATLLIPFIRTKLNENGEIKDPATLDAIKNVTKAFLQVIQTTEKIDLNKLQ
jgi:NAD(P)H-dependent FMN reductase